MINRVRSIVEGHKRGAVLFALVGLVNTATDFAVYSAGIFFGLPPVFANTVSFFVANFQSYRINAAVTFRRDGVAAPVSFKNYIRFAVAHVVGLLISTGFIIGFAGMVGPYYAKAMALVFSAASNYVLSVIFVFRRDSAPKTGSESI